MRGTDLAGYAAVRLRGDLRSLSGASQVSRVLPGKEECCNQLCARSGRDIQATIGIAGNTQPSPATT